MIDKNLFKIALVVVMLPVVIIAGCSDRYRYPCQNPANWETAQCQKPLCEVNRDCPDLIFKEKSSSVGIKSDQISSTTACEKGSK